MPALPDQEIGYLAKIACMRFSPFATASSGFMPLITSDFRHAPQMFVIHLRQGRVVDRWPHRGRAQHALRDRRDAGRILRVEPVGVGLHE